MSEVIPFPDRGGGGFRCGSRAGDWRRTAATATNVASLSDAGLRRGPQTPSADQADQASRTDVILVILLATLEALSRKESRLRTDEKALSALTSAYQRHKATPDRAAAILAAVKMLGAFEPGSW